MIKIFCPRILKSEMFYVIDYVFSTRLGIEYTIEYNISDCIEIANVSSDSVIKLSIDGFCKMSEAWLEKDSLPSEPIRRIKSPISDESLPVIYGHGDIRITNSYSYIGVDIFASIFFMLSRYEEAVVRDVLDEHGRFPGRCSLAYKNSFLERPIVDEYVELLWFCLQSHWPDLVRITKTPSTFVTCDVDWPFDPTCRNFKFMIRASVGDIIKRKSLKSSLLRWVRYFQRLMKLPYCDLNRDKISWIMTENEKYNNKVAFYFVTNCTSDFDSCFDFDSKEIRELFLEIYTRGHEIGLHPGYECYNNPTKFQVAANILKRALDEEGIKQSQLGGRMHFLRWDVLKTPQLWESEGFDYDSTLAYADKSGFRCGTCHTFSMYDIVNRKILKLQQRPLINMECTVISPGYENFSYSNNCALERFKMFKAETYKYRGEYVLLWHNTHFSTDDDMSIYTELIK